MESASKSSIWATGFAMFSMFFGAGNIVYPLITGYQAEGRVGFAILGLLISAVGVPFLGLIGMTLFNGNAKLFFERIGKVPGFLVALLIMGLIGPFGAMPRLVTVSHATLAIRFPEVSLWLFGAIFCLITFLFTVRKNRILDLLGFYLTPFLLLTLGIIAAKGMLSGSMPDASTMTRWSAFSAGMHTGYETMDLLGAFFFASIALSCLEVTEIEKGHTKNFRNVIFMTLKASAVGAVLLGAVYIGFCYIAAIHSESLRELTSDKYLGQIALMTLGEYAGFVAITAVGLACLTTAIALGAVFAEFMQREIFLNRIGYTLSLSLTLITTFLISLFSFTGLAKILQPILWVLYPGLIVLTICNIAHKLFHVNIVKTPFALTILASFTVFLVNYLYPSY